MTKFIIEHDSAIQVVAESKDAAYAALAEITCLSVEDLLADDCLRCAPCTDDLAEYVEKYGTPDRWDVKADGTRTLYAEDRACLAIK